MKQTVSSSLITAPDVLRVVQEDCPEPKHGEVLVRVQAAGVSLPDIMAREGIHPEAPRVPFTPGWDLVGVVVDRIGGVARQSNRARLLLRCRSTARTRSSFACRKGNWFQCLPGWTLPRLSASF